MTYFTPRPFLLAVPMGIATVILVACAQPSEQLHTDDRPRIVVEAGAPPGRNIQIALHRGPGRQLIENKLRILGNVEQSGVESEGLGVALDSTAR